jgi:hypothetical protein
MLAGGLLRGMGSRRAARLVDSVLLLLLAVLIPLAALAALAYWKYYAPWVAGCGVVGEPARYFHGLVWVAYACFVWSSGEVLLYAAARRSLVREKRHLEKEGRSSP